MEKRRRRAWAPSSPMSCFEPRGVFAGEAVEGKEDHGPGRRTRSTTTGCIPWSVFKKSKKTVPVDSSAAAAAGTEKIIEDKAGKEGKGKHEVNRRKKDETFQTEAEDAETDLLHKSFPKTEFEKKANATPPEAQPSRSLTRLSPRSSPKLDTTHEPAHASSLEQEPERTDTASASVAPGPATAPGSPPVRARPVSTIQCRKPVKVAPETLTKRQEEAATTSGLDPMVVGTSFLLITVAMLTLGGRVCAILCTCAWFYLVPWLRPSVPGGGGTPRGEAPPPSAEAEGAQIDGRDSGEYKKRVVLERNRRGRPLFRSTGM